ncbi:MAG: Rrf2 family transcriptional regulator [Pleurocapsa minor GSE-CHR-MK-17-07R]|jgi:Rrf2 family protein|nr:Rrf2 family transcriptional regulator [Pleurocapsa minor GSE-CHR-MK 17-07R]
MKLTSRSEYGLLALVYLARQPAEAYVHVETIATQQQIPAKFLEQILLSLKRGQYVHSMKGHNGGYRLAKAPSDITLAEIIRMIDGPLAPTESVSLHYYRATPIQKETALVEVFARVRDCMLEIMEHTTLADVM